MRCVIATEIQLQQHIGALRAAWKEHRYIRASFSHDKARSLRQNGIGHVWYEQISRELGEDSPHDVKRFCKLHYGVPILRAEDEEFCTAYDRVIKPLPYERKLEAMDLLPVTSRMNVSQKSKYLEEVQRQYARRGVQLEFPEAA